MHLIVTQVLSCSYHTTDTLLILLQQELLSLPIKQLLIILVIMTIILKKDILGAKPITNNTSKSSSSAISKLNWQEEKVKQAQQKKIKNEIKRTEERMALIEAEIEELDNMYADPAISSDTAKLMEIHTRKEALSKELDELYDKWGELTL